MKNIVRPTLFTAACAALALSLAPAPRAADAEQRERKFQFEYKATVKDIPAGSKQLDLWIPVPHDGLFQKITGLQIDSPHPYEIKTAQHGNRVLHLRVENPPRDNFAVTMRFDAARREHVQSRLRQANFAPVEEERDPDMARWLQPDRLVPLDGKIKQWAKEVVDAANAKTDLEKARAIYNHVV